MKKLSNFITDNFSESFIEISKYLLNYVVLVDTINKKKFRLTEIEYYLYCKNHEDCSTHCSEKQLHTNFFYFHRYSNLNYITNNRKGMDITFGSNKNNTKVFGGILIRAIMNINNNKEYIYGTSKIIDHLLNNTEGNPITLSNIFKDIESREIDKKNDYFYFKEHKLDELTIYRCPRFNLPKHTNEEYLFSYYRHFIFPKKKHAGKEQEIICRWIKEERYSKDETKKIFGYNSIEFCNKK